MAFKVIKNVFARLGPPASYFAPTASKQPVNASLKGSHLITVELAGSLEDKVSARHCGRDVSSLCVVTILAAHHLWQVVVCKDWVCVRPRWQQDDTLQK